MEFERNLEKEAYKRNFKRLDVELNAAIAPVDYRQDRPIPCKCSNISETGCFLVTDHKFLLGDRIRVEIELPNHQLAVLLGRVVWIRHIQKGRSQPQGVGIEYLSGQDEDLNALKGFLSAL